MSATTATRTLPTINITCSTADKINANSQQRATKMYNDSSIIKSGILELCHLVSSSNGNILVGEKVLVTIYRTCGEYFAVINLLNNETFGHQQLSSGSIPSSMCELNSNSICINLKHSKVEKCNNAQFFKLVLNDFTSVILFRVVKPKEQQTHLATPQQQTINNQQSKSLGDLSVINEIDNESNQKSSPNDQTVSWIKAFSENHQSSEADHSTHLLRANNLIPLTRRQSLQTVIESDEEEEPQYHSLH